MLTPLDTFEISVLVLVELGNKNGKKQISNPSQVIKLFKKFCSEQKIIAHSIIKNRSGFYSALYSMPDAHTILKWFIENKIEGQTGIDEKTGFPHVYGQDDINLTVPRIYCYGSGSDCSDDCDCGRDD